MAKVCYVCEKKTGRGHKVSHAQNKSKRNFKPNLRRVRIVEDGTTKRVRVCTKCLKADKVERAFTPPTQKAEE